MEAPPFDISPAAAIGFVTLGVVVGLLNVLAGGGSLLAMPALIFAGLPATVANGTVRIAILLQNITAVTRYHHAGKLETKLLPRFIAPTLTGAAAGAYAATVVSDFAFKTILGAVMLAVAAVVIFNPRWMRGNTNEGDEAPALRLQPAALWPTLFVAGFYGGMIQAGVGYVLLAGLVLIVRQDLVAANIMKVVLIGSYTVLAVGIFVAQGKVDFAYAILLAVGQSAGAWLGASLALKKGVKAIRVALVVAVVLMGLKLLGAIDRVLDALI